MKKAIFFFISMMALSLSSCSDMLDVEDKRHLDGDATIDSKTDSLFYAWGIMQAMQQAADIYVVQNEMRGDLVTTTNYSSTHLREMADYTATTANKYDSAYVYYKVINNCNNYIAHRDTALYNGSYNVTLEEYASVYAFRAWAYIQLARMYGRVKFFTHPLTTISQIDSDNSPELDLYQIIDALAPDLEKFTGYAVPMPSYIAKVGNTNLGAAKEIAMGRCYIPVDVILGEMYLERGRYLDAAKHYYRYLYDNKLLAINFKASLTNRDEETFFPGDLSFGSSGDLNFLSYFSTGLASNAANTCVSYIPMAVNYLRGKTTEIPELFGYDYYATSRDVMSVYVNPQITPSKVYYEIADSSVYYYTSSYDNSYSSANLGDMRCYNRRTKANYTSNGVSYDIDLPDTYMAGNIILYRPSTIWLHLAEALNRLGYPDAAFAVLKDGIGIGLASESDCPYITSKTRELFAETGPLPFFGTDAQSVFNFNLQKVNYGIHGYGCGDSEGIKGPNSLYQMETEVGRKVEQIEKEFNMSIIQEPLEKTFLCDLSEYPAVLNKKTAAADSAAKAEILKLIPEDKYKIASTVVTGTINKNTTEVEISVTVTLVNKTDVVNAIEDLLCDEYAMELAFEGSRFTDLTRMARHKNESGLYGANFGGKWFDKKLKNNNPSIAKDLTVEQNWYLPLR